MTIPVWLLPQGSVSHLLEVCLTSSLSITLLATPHLTIHTQSQPSQVKQHKTKMKKTRVAVQNLILHIPSTTMKPSNETNHLLVGRVNSALVMDARQVTAYYFITNIEAGVRRSVLLLHLCQSNYRTQYSGSARVWPVFQWRPL